MKIILALCCMGLGVVGIVLLLVEALPPLVVFLLLIVTLACFMPVAKL